MPTTVLTAETEYRPQTLPLNRFALILTWDFDDPLCTPRLVLSRPGQDPEWKPLPGVIVDDAVIEEVYEAVYQALSSQEVTLDAVDD